MFHIHQTVVWWFSFWCSLPLPDLPVCVKWKNDSCFITMTHLYHDIVMKLFNIKLLLCAPFLWPVSSSWGCPAWGWGTDGRSPTHSPGCLGLARSVQGAGRWGGVGLHPTAPRSRVHCRPLPQSLDLPGKLEWEKIKTSYSNRNVREYILKSRALLFFREFNLT